MKIKSVELFHIRIPCTYPFKTSFGVINDRPSLIIKLLSDQGLVGYGETSTNDTPMVEPETTSEALELLKERLPKLIGLPVNEELDIVELFGDPRYPVSLFGIEAAYLDLLAKSKGITLSKFFGAANTQVLAGESVGMQPSIEKTVERVGLFIKDGYSRIKIKISKGHDEELIRAVRQAFPLLYLGADANADYTNEDVSYLAGFVKYNLAFIEQPFAADDYKSSAALNSLGVKVCLDEAVLSLETCKKAIEEKTCDMINIKPARVGSFKEAKKIHDLCVKEGIKLFGGGRLETGIGTSANAAFYALPGFNEASDVTRPLNNYDTDIIDPSFDITNGIHTIPNLPGIGVNVDEKALNKFTVKHYTFQ
jgi:O-succinylbenzoate synthase